MIGGYSEQRALGCNGEERCGRPLELDKFKKANLFDGHIKPAVTDGSRHWNNSSRC